MCLVCNLDWSNRDWCILRILVLWPLLQRFSSTKYKIEIWSCMLRCVLPIYFVLTSGHSSCWNADYSHNTISCVSMLTSSSLQSIPLNMKIGFVDLRTSRSFIQSWNNDDSGKRSMSALVAVKWGNPHQSVHSYICFGIANGIFTIHFGSF